MRKSRFKKVLCTIFSVFTFFWTLPGWSQSEATPTKPLVYYVEIHADIMPAAWRTMGRALDEATAARADLIVLSLDTYGGLLDAADSIRTRLLACKIPVLVHITNNAASAGALIAMACDSIYMTPYAKMGAASVVDQSGAVMPDKYQSFMRGMMRSTAEANGRNPDIAEAMVGAIKTIPGVIDSGKVLTLTSKEALQLGFCEGEAASWQDALQQAGYAEYTLQAFEPTAMDKAMGFLLSPVLRGLLITFIFLGIYFELQTPGIGFALGIAVTAALLYFAPLYLEGLAANWEILLFVVGLVLIGLELFVIPGFGIAGVSGAALVFTGLLLSMVRNEGFRFEFTGTDALLQAFGVMMAAISVTIGVVVLFFGRFLNSALFKKVSLSTSENNTEGYNTNLDSLRHLSGTLAVAITDLRPSGKIEVNGEWLDAQTDAAYIVKGTTVKIIDIKNNYVIVRPV